MWTERVRFREQATDFASGPVRTPSVSGFLVPVLVFLAFAATGCMQAPVLPTETPRLIGLASENVRAHIYVDASPSMRGFARPGSGGQYGILLQEMELALQKGWKATSTQYFRFGVIREPIVQPPPVYLQATKPDFYGGTGFLDTRIDLALGDASPSNLTLVVTDLFQQDADVSSLIEKVKQKVLPGRLALAILGVKAEFDGTIYDVGQQRLSFPWNSEGNARRYRPFYVLMVGSTANVLRFTEVLRGASRTIRAADLVILSPELLRTPLNWKNVQVNYKRGVSPDARIVQPPVSGGLVFNKIDRGDVEIDATLAYDAVPGAPAVRFNKLSPVVPEVTLWSNSWFLGPSRARSLVGSGPGVGDFELSQKGERLNLKVRISRQELPYQGTYIVKLSPVLNSEIFEFPSFCNDWNLDMVATTHLESGAKFDGTKTQNLATLIRSVWDVMLQEYHPAIGSLYFYLKR